MDNMDFMDSMDLMDVHKVHKVHIVHNMHYSSLIGKLFRTNLYGGIKLGLDNCRRLQEILNNPTRQFASIHVAGTNGKGSVTTMIAKALEASGYRVGLYTSPHISSFRERIQINGTLISEQATEQLLSLLFDTVEQHQIPATFFELTTFLAFLYFAQENVDFAVLETGLGGRLDATNVVTPLLSVITSISLEHTPILGTTLEEIAKEKAGIIKPKVPVVIGPRVPLSVVQSIAAEQHSPLTIVKGQFDLFMEENQAIAYAALKELDLPEKAIEEGLKARQPCRLEMWNDRVILDVAHNPDGLTHLFQAIRIRYGNIPIRLLFGLSKNKDIPSCLKIICKNAQAFHLIEAPNGRGLPIADLYQEMNKYHSDLSCHPSIADGVKAALELSQANKELLVVCGTFFIMSQVRQALGYQEPVDPIDMNEMAVPIQKPQSAQI